MSTNRVAVTERNLDEALESTPAASQRLAPDAPLRPGGSLSARRALEIFEDQVLSRQLDVAARELKKTGESFYTIASAGHEQNAVVGSLLRTTDPAFLAVRFPRRPLVKWRFVLVGSDGSTREGRIEADQQAPEGWDFRVFWK